MGNLLQNVRFNFFAFMAGKAMAAIVGLAVPRILGPEKMGQYVSAWGLAAMVSLLADLGLGAYVTREASRFRADTDRVSALFYRALLAQLLQLSAAAGLLGVMVLWGRGLSVSASLVALAFAGNALAAFSNPLSATLQGLEKYKVTGMVSSAASLLNAAAIGLALWLRPDPAGVLGALALSGILGLALWFVVFKRQGLIRGSWARLDLGAFYRGTLPFAFVSIANQLYIRVDIVILTYLLGAQALGQYGAAVKVVDLCVPVLGALAGPLYPRLSATFGGDSLRRALRYLTAVCLPLGVGGMVLATPLMIWLFKSDFSEAGRAFRWLAWVPALIGVHGALLHAMNALGKTKLIGLIFLTNLIVNVGLNFALVPRFGFEASAALSLLCEAVVLVSSGWILARAGLHLGVARMLWPALPAAFGMGLVLRLLPSPSGWLVPVFVTSGMVIYLSLLWALGFVGSEERVHLKRMLSRQT